MKAKYFWALILVSFLVSCSTNPKNSAEDGDNISGTGSLLNVELERIKTTFQSESTSIKNYYLGNIQVQLLQTKGDGSEFYCRANLSVYKDGKKTDSIHIQPEPVVGEYGFSKALVVDDHLIITSHGDYDGRTIIVNQSGELFNIIGGKNYLDQKSNRLFTTYDSDLAGFAIFDLKNDSIIWEMEELPEYPISFHKKYENRYFLICIGDEVSEKSIWEVEIEEGRIMRQDMELSSFNSQNELMKLTTPDAKCTCED